MYSVYLTHITDHRSELIDHKDRIILVSCSANVVSKYTSFVGVDKIQTVSADKKLIHRVIPTPLARDDLSIGDVAEYLETSMIDRKFRLVTMDISKAFDCVPHCLTICKLHAYGFSRDACKLIASYLYRRKQRVKIGKVKSDLK